MNERMKKRRDAFVDDFFEYAGICAAFASFLVLLSGILVITVFLIKLIV